MSPKHKRGRERKGGMSKTDLARKLRDLETPLRRIKSGSAPFKKKNLLQRTLQWTFTSRTHNSIPTMPRTSARPRLEASYGSSS